MTSHEQRYRLGPVTVSRIGFGAMQLPGPGVFGPPRDRGQAIAVLQRAVESERSTRPDRSRRAPTLLTSASPSGYGYSAALMSSFATAGP